MYIRQYDCMYKQRSMVECIKMVAILFPPNNPLHCSPHHQHSAFTLHHTHTRTITYLMNHLTPHHTPYINHISHYPQSSYSSPFTPSPPYQSHLTPLSPYTSPSTPSQPIPKPSLKCTPLSLIPLPPHT